MPWKRIILVGSVLIGGVTIFSYWFINQFNQALDDLSASSLADTKPSITAITTTATTTPAADTSTDSELSFTFPQKNDEVFIGCTYQLSWQFSATINSLEAALVDAGARKLIEPAASGLAKESAIEKDSQNINWKVGVVWPGEYYIKVLNINGVNSEIRGEVFTISSLPEDISADEREKICKKSGGSF